MGVTNGRPRGRNTSTLLISSTGKRLRYTVVQPIFKKMLHHCGIVPRSATCRPGIHDLRHSFAVSTIVDNYRTGDPGWQGAKGLNVPDNITLLKLPPYAPELNPMENVWQYLRANQLAITVFDSYEDILGKCAEARNFFAKDPKRITSITERDWIKINQ